LYNAPNTFRVIQPKRMRWTGHVARMEDNINTYRGLVEKPKEGDHLVEVSVDGKVILKWIIQNLGWESMDCIDLASGTNGEPM